MLKAIKRESITWRSWWDGGNTQGPIATQWNVKGWPTLYILDHNGIIRHKNLRGDAMESAVRKDGTINRAIRPCEASLLAYSVAAGRSW